MFLSPGSRARLNTVVRFVLQRLSTSQQAQARSNIGVVFASTPSIIGFGSAAALAGGATVFFGQGVSGAADAQYLIMPRAGVLSNFTGQTNSAPGGIQTYTITLDKGTGATALTFTITGAGQTGSDNVHTVSVIQGDFLSVKAVASATAATSTGNYFSVLFTPT